MTESNSESRAATPPAAETCCSEGGRVISTLNRLVDHIEGHLTEDLDIAALARSLGTTDYHLRRMFSALAGMPLSE
jgi:AraC family transcriptional regulator